MPNQDMGCKVNVKIDSRRFIEEPTGELISNTGKRGYYSEWNTEEVHNLLTDDGRDFLHTQGYASSGIGSNGANYIAVSTDGTAPADGDSTLTGEISSGGLSRAQGSISHSTGTNSTEIQHTFTATASHTDVQKSALFTAASSGTMVHEAQFTAVSLETDDQLRITWTITIDD